MVWGEKSWFPLIDVSVDGKLEYDPKAGIYGMGVDKNAAHVICK